MADHDEKRPSEAAESGTNDKTPVVTEVSSSPSASQSIDEKPPPPWQWKLIAVVLVTLIRFGGIWASGLNGSLKSVLKKELEIDNTKFALLASCEDFMKTLLMLFTGVFTDRFGGANLLFWGNIVYSIGSILNAAAAQVRSFDFMIGANVIMSLGDISTQVAQYQVFSAWFAPGNGFASTLGLELMVAKCGGLAGTASANAIAKGTGNFAWVYWIAFFVNLFTNVVCGAFYWFIHTSKGKYGLIKDPATGERLRNSAKKLNFKIIFEMPWTLWVIIAYTLFTTGTISVFNTNATELAEQRFKVDAVQAGWYTAILRYGSFAIIPAVAVLTDFYGNRVTFMLITGCGVFIAMTLLNYGDELSGTIASFAFFAATSTFSALVIIDSIRAVLPDQTTFGTAYALKLLANNSMNVIMAIGAGVIQDRDGNSYHNVVKLFMAVSCVALGVSVFLAMLTFTTTDFRALQWTRVQRIAEGETLNERFARFYKEDYSKTKFISTTCCIALGVLILGSWAAFIWGAATGNNY